MKHVHRVDTSRDTPRCGANSQSGVHASLIEQYRLTEGDQVAVEYRGSLDHSFVPRCALILGGEITVGGCIPSAGMIGRVLSLPYRFEQIEHPIEIEAGGLHYCTMAKTTVAVFADGTKLWRGRIGGAIVWLTGRGEEQSDVITEAIQRTPC